MPTWESVSIVARGETAAGVQGPVMDMSGVSVPAGMSIGVAGKLIHDEQVINLNVLATTVSQFVHIIRSGRWAVSVVTEYHGTNSTSGTLQVEVCTGTAGPGSGVAQLTGTINLGAGATTVQNGTVIASPTIAGPGDRIGIVIAGTMTNLANCIVHIGLRKVSA